MSMIMGVGTKLSWSPSDEKLQKTASTGEQEVQEEVNPLYEAAAAFLKRQAEDASECEEGEMEEGEMDKESMGACTDDEVVELDVEEEEEAPEEVAEIKTDVAEAVQEVVEKAEEAEAIVERVEEALEGVEEAVESVREAVDPNGESEVEVEIEVEEVSDEEGEEEPGGEDIVVESEPEVEEEEFKMDKSASSEEFCKFAKLSPANKKKLVDFWSKALNYPMDYVKLMVKDYEK